jgi:DNA processing protein
VTDPDRLARAALSRAVPAGDPRVGRAVRHAGAVAVWASLRASLAQHGPVVDPVDDVARQERLGGRLVVPGDSQWPCAVDDLARIGGSGPLGRAAPPLALWAVGPLPAGEAVHRCVAIVGSRAATDYGVHLAGELAAGLAERGYRIVSGAAYGIDGTAHRAALAVGGSTVAVLAGGCDVPYPAGHSTLLERIAAQGLLLSESPPGVAPGRVRFLSRNRLIAALAGATVLVEAGVRSGARNTLSYARGLGRARLVVPGPVTSAMSAGCHAELRADPETRVVTCAADVVEELGCMGADASPPAPEDPRDGLDPQERALLDALPARRPIGPAELARLAGQDPARVTRRLAILVAAGLVDHDGGLFRLSTLGRAPSAR